MQFSISIPDLKHINLALEIFGYELELKPHTCPNCEPWNYPGTTEYASWLLGYQLEKRGITPVAGGYACTDCNELIMDDPVTGRVEINGLVELREAHECTPAVTEAEQEHDL